MLIHSWSPWHGCAKVSPGCERCYAEAGSHRNPAVLGTWGANGTRVVRAESGWDLPVRWDRQAAKAGERHRVFPSICDPFEDRLDLVEPRARFFDLISRTPNLDWVLLTKRPEAAKAILRDQVFISRDNGRERLSAWEAMRLGLLDNVEIGVSVEDQRRADERIPALLSIPAATHFLCLEPLLGPVDLRAIKIDQCWPGKQRETSRLDALHGFTYSKRELYVLGGVVEEKGEMDFVDLHYAGQIDWVVVGPESGPKARPCDPAWIHSIVEQCNAASVPVHVKNWG